MQADPSPHIYKMSYDSLLAKLSDKSISQSLITMFSEVFQPLTESAPLNRLTERKFAQKYGAQLLNLIQRSSSLLKTRISGGKADVLLGLIKRALTCMQKIKHEDLYECSYSYIVRLIECKRYKSVVHESESLLVLIEYMDTPKVKMLELNTLIAKSNALLQGETVSISELETVYDLIAKRGRKIIGSVVFPRDLHNSLNNVYLSSFKLLFKVGKLLDLSLIHI